MTHLPLAWLPNVEGFRFVGILRDGTEAECVVKLVEGCFTVDRFEELVGWRGGSWRNDGADRR